jgi:hypothetical protein
MFTIYFRGEAIASYASPYIAACVAISRFTVGQILRGEVEVI